MINLRANHGGCLPPGSYHRGRRAWMVSPRPVPGVMATLVVSSASARRAGIQPSTALFRVYSGQKSQQGPRRKSVTAMVDIDGPQGYRFCHTQEVEGGTAETNCRACGSSRTRSSRAASSTRVIQQYDRVTEGKEQNAIRIARARKKSARVPQGPGLEGGPRSSISDPRSPALPGGTCGHRRPAQCAGRWC